VQGDEGRLGQVFLNLLLNAAHAMAGGDPDRNELYVSTRLERPADGPGQVSITIRDTGMGMAPEVLERIFDPFFTTKPIGTGTGLGLSVCHGVVRDLGGSIQVTSEPRRGSTFVVRLPEAERSAEPRSVSHVRPAGARGRVLVVDDEPLVLTVLSRMLSPVHEVVTVNSARQALAELSLGPPFDVIICDLLMPEMSGMDLYQEVLARFPELADHMIFLSGGANTSQVTEFVSGISNPTLAKPPSQIELLMAIQREMDGSREREPRVASDPRRRPN
jgi:CheY-like chemotaxis protein